VPVPAKLAAEVRGLVARHEARHGVAGLSEGRLRALDAAARGAEVGLEAVTARRSDDGELVGWAQVDDDAGGGIRALEVMAVDDDPAVADALADRVIARADAAGKGPLRWWVSPVGTADDARATSRGFQVERDLLQLRCRLPLPRRPGRHGATAITRAFRVGSDEAAWLIQNNRAFADHPEQGHWDLATLVEREGEPWFDADGFRVLEVDGRIAGSCWTKIHRDTRPPLGEIYVIGVDPDFHGRGWGRLLTDDGFAWLAATGLDDGMLYVDAANTAALSLYRSMGLTTHHVDRAYRRDDGEDGSVHADQVTDTERHPGRRRGDQELTAGRPQPPPTGEERQGRPDDQ
jgi:mycothiol synthase